MYARVWGLLTLLLACGSSSSDGAEDDYRLPRNVAPLSYNIRITPAYSNEERILGITSYSGTVHIRTNILSQTEQIVINHGVNIKIVDTCVEYASGTNDGNGVCTGQGVLVELGTKHYNITTEKYTINLKESLTPALTMISFGFTSDIQKEQQTGLFYTSYAANGTETALLATQLQPSYARQLFPCFDEPRFKADFNLAIRVKHGISAIANTPGNRTNNEMTFEPILSMSPNMLAFIIYEDGFFSSQNNNLNEVLHSTWARPESLEAGDGDLSQRDGPRMLQIMNNYVINPTYETYMSKMDHVAIPNFFSETMPNWGLITYRESALLFNKETGTTAEHKLVSETIAHEIAYQWYGNLVGAEWWDSIWLNEGFATYFEMLIMADSYIEWRIEERFLLEEQMNVFSLDAQSNSVALTNPKVKSPAQLEDFFQWISYSKGAAILRQISNVVGSSDFLNACRNYLKQNIGNPATTETLLKYFLEENDFDKTGLENRELKEALETWTMLPRFPIITVRRLSPVLYVVSQERFLQTHKNIPEETPQPWYYVPLTWTTSKQKPPTGPTAPDAWLTNQTSSRALDFQDLTDDDWVLFNSWQSGYYRVNYDDGLWDNIITSLKENPNSIVPIDRAAIVDNLLTLAQTGYVSYERAVNGIGFLKNEDDFIPWAAARMALGYLDRMIGSDPAYQEFIQGIVANAYVNLDWDTSGDSEDFAERNVELTHRVNVFTMACASGNLDCLAKAEARLKNYSPKDKELQSLVYCYGLKNNGSQELWDSVWKEWKDSGSNAARRSLLTKALGCINDPSILTEYLEQSLEPEVLRAQEAHTIFVAVYSNPDGVNIALEFLEKKGYEALQNAYGSQDNVMDKIILELAERLTTEYQKSTLVLALGEHAVAHGNALQAVESNILWVETYAASVRKALENGGPMITVSKLILSLCAATHILFL